MATIDYKEKYEKAVQAALLAKQDTESAVTIGILEDIFPELKESENEKIRKYLLKLCDRWVISGVAESFETASIKVDNIIAWLERQGECHISHDDEIMIKQLTEYFITGHGLQNTNETVVAWLNDVKEKLEKQGEQKPVDFSDFRTWKYIVDAVWTEKEGIGQYIDNPFAEEVAKKLQKRFGNIEQKSAWSEDDEKELCRVVYMMEQLELTESWSDCYTFLKSLKDRVQLQPKQEWSEEDKEKIELIDAMCDDGLKDCVKGSTMYREYHELKDWLKSLRPQKQWKPTEEQLRELHCVISGCSYETPVLVELEKQLKNLL